MTSRVGVEKTRKETVNKRAGQNVYFYVIRSRFIHGFLILVVDLSFLATGPTAKAENPLEKLRRHILGELFGDDTGKDHDKKKKKKHKDDDRRDDWDRGSSGEWSVQFNLQPLIEKLGNGEDRFDTYAAPAPRTSAQPHPLEQEVQAALQREGYYRGQIDGDLDSSTRAAIRDYQSDHSLAATGRINRDLLRSLGL